MRLPPPTLRSCITCRPDSKYRFGGAVIRKLSESGNTLLETLLKEQVAPCGIAPLLRDGQRQSGDPGSSDRLRGTEVIRFLTTKQELGANSRKPCSDGLRLFFIRAMPCGSFGTDKAEERMQQPPLEKKLSGCYNWVCTKHFPAISGTFRHRLSIREGCTMKEPSLWTLFSDTGDPLAYLLYRAGSAGR